MSTNSINKDEIRILIIDDDKDIRDILEEVLKYHGYTNIKTIGTGEEAISILKADFYNIAIIDLNLPDIHGMDLIKQLRLFSPDSEFIIVTGYGSLDSAIKALQFEVGGYLEKPISTDKLIRTLEEVLEKHTLKLANQKFLEDLEIANKEILFLNDLLVNNVDNLNQSLLLTMVQIEKLDPTGEQRKVLQLFQQAIRKNARLTGNIRKLQKIDEITLDTLEEKDLTLFINNAINRLREDYSDKKFEIQYDINSQQMIIADNNLIHLIIELLRIAILNDPSPNIRIKIDFEDYEKNESKYVKMSIYSFLARLVYEQKDIIHPSELKALTTDLTFQDLGPFLVNSIVKNYNGFVDFPEGETSRNYVEIYFLKPKKK